MSTKKCAVVYYTNNRLIQNKISDIEVYLDNSGPYKHRNREMNPDMWLDFEMSELQNKIKTITLFISEVDSDSELIKFEVPNLIEMTEEENFQYSLLNPFLKLGSHSVDIGLVQSIIEFVSADILNYDVDRNLKVEVIDFEY